MRIIIETDAASPQPSVHLTPGEGSAAVSEAPIDAGPGAAFVGDAPSSDAGAMDAGPPPSWLVEEIDRLRAAAESEGDGDAGPGPQS